MFGSVMSSPPRSWRSCPSFGRWASSISSPIKQLDRLAAPLATCSASAPAMLRCGNDAVDLENGRSSKFSRATQRPATLAGRQGDRPVSNQGRSTAVVGAAGAGNAEVMELAPNAARFRRFAVFLVLWCRAKGARHSERREGWLGAKFDLDSDSAQVVDGSACRMIVQSSDDFSM